MDIKTQNFDGNTKSGVCVYWEDGLEHCVRFLKPIDKVTMPEIIDALTVLDNWHVTKLGSA